MMIKFPTYLPREDSALTEILLQSSAPVSIELHQKNTTLRDFRRLLEVARSAAVQVYQLLVTELSFLNGYDKQPFLSGLKPDASIVYGLLELEVSLKFQPRTFKQMEELSCMIANSKDLRKLTLTAFEYPTGEFLESEGFKKLAPLEASFLCPLPAILEMQTAQEKKARDEDEEARRIAEIYVQSITGCKTIESEQRVAPLEAMISASLAAEAAAELPTEQAAQSPAPAMAPTRHSTTDLAAPAGTPALKHMTRAESDGALLALLSAPLPPSLEEASLRLPIPTPPPPGFLAHLPLLATLSLAYCGLTDAALAALAPVLRGLHALRRLSLARNALVDADLAPLAAPHLATLDLSANPLRGPAAAALIAALHCHAALADIDLSLTALRTPGLSFDGLACWAAPAARLTLPAVFSPEEVRAIEALLPDGATLVLDGPAFHDRGGNGGGGCGEPPRLGL